MTKNVPKLSGSVLGLLVVRATYTGDVSVKKSSEKIILLAQTVPEPDMTINVPKLSISGPGFKST